MHNTRPGVVGLQPPLSHPAHGASNPITNMNDSAARVLRLPSISSPSAPELRSHIATAKANANDWLHSTSEKLASSMAGCSAFVVAFHSKYPNPLVSMLPDIDSRKDQFKAIIDGLLRSGRAAHATAEAAIGVVGDLKRRVDQDARGLAGDASTVAATLSGDEKAINDLRTRIARLERRIQKERALERALEAAFVWAPGLGDIAALLAHLLSDQAAVERDLRSLEGSDSTLRADAGKLSTFLSVISHFRETALAGMGSLGALGSGLQTIASDLDETSRGIADAKPGLGPWLTSQLEACKAQVDQTHELFQILTTSS